MSAGQVRFSRRDIDAAADSHYNGEKGHTIITGRKRHCLERTCAPHQYDPGTSSPIDQHS